MKTIFYIICLIYIHCFSACCHRDVNLKLFPENITKLNPYTGQENLIFINQHGEQIAFNNGNRVISRFSWQPNSDHLFACTSTMLEEQTDVTLFHSNYREGRLAIAIGSPDYWMYQGFKISLSMKETNTYISFPKLNLDTMVYRPNTSKYFKESVPIRNEIFKNVFVLPGTYWEDYKERPAPDTLFYNVTIGIIGFKLADGNFFMVSN